MASEPLGSPEHCNGDSCGAGLGTAKLPWTPSFDHPSGRAIYSASDCRCPGPFGSLWPSRMDQRCIGLGRVCQTIHLWRAGCYSGPCVFQFTFGDAALAASLDGDPGRAISSGRKPWCHAMGLLSTDRRADAARYGSRGFPACLLTMPHQLCCSIGGRGRAKGHNDRARHLSGVSLGF